MKRIILFCLCVIFLLGGCAPWAMMGGKYTMSSQNFEAVFPEGWRRHNLTKEALLATKDGLTLQQIRIGRFSVDTELAYTKKKFSKEMFPQEAAAVVIDNAHSNPNSMNIQIIENMPVMIGGHSGFKIVYSYQTGEGLELKTVQYGFLLTDWYYYLNYIAPARYYFEKELPAFEKVKETFKTL